MDNKKTISEVTKRDIFDSLRSKNINWSGRLDEIDFLSRLYDLENLPSFDHRYNNAQDDIFQHRIINYDWDDYWVFNDRRFELMYGTDEVFLKFLCEMVHPVVRPDTNEALNLVMMFNDFLANDGWEISELTKISGKPVFAPKRRIINGEFAVEPAKDIASSLNADYLIKQITRMQYAINSDPELAIGTAKEFLETICKTILRAYGQEIPNDIKLTELVKEVRQKLSLLPEDIPSKAKGYDIIRRIVSNLGSMAQGISELRGLYGTGHGKEASVKGLKSRHAKLAVGSATTLAVFLFETFQEKLGENLKLKKDN